MFGFEYVGLSVADLDTQRRFYGLAFGLSEEEATIDIPDAGIRTSPPESQSGNVSHA